MSDNALLTALHNELTLRRATVRMSEGGHSYTAYTLKVGKVKPGRWHRLLVWLRLRGERDERQ
jgi:hypothetical protein